MRFIADAFMKIFGLKPALELKPQEGPPPFNPPTRLTRMQKDAIFRIATGSGWPLSRYMWNKLGKIGMVLNSHLTVEGVIVFNRIKQDMEHKKRMDEIAEVSKLFMPKEYISDKIMPRLARQPKP